MIDDFLSHSVVGALVFGLGGGIFMMYGFGLAIMLLLRRMGDRPLRPIIAYSLTTFGALACALPSRQWWLMILILLVGAGCMAFHLFALIGRNIPDEPPPVDDWIDEDPDEVDGEPDSR